ncbi:hypothetical protein Igag_1254 [Ignisphaera aggregans DSM 17230]|uniref:Uncharacterized protein n=1 Tax=Ignisphaera aggregans (strain DSM 17230 / JCM 13409 / AQ1.S1) TaxID=583356 RepID=E0SPK4_IGNAA|nr:hypothetical protein Igag_1254 [Ignisphaera aggregans DSM 17230]
MSEEVVLGGITSLELGGGYGIYVTNRRIIGVKKGLFVKKVLSGLLSLIITVLIFVIIGLLTFGVAVGGTLGVMFGLLMMRFGRWITKTIAPGLVRDTNPKSLAELDTNKDYEIRKEDIDYIEIKEPYMFESGYIKIVRKGGSKDKEKHISISDRYEYEYLLELLRKFYPEALRV